MKVIHKQGPQTFTKYIGFGQYEEVHAPLCVGAKGVYNGNSYYTHRMWKYVTCVHCLKRKKSNG